MQSNLNYLSLACVYCYTKSLNFILFRYHQVNYLFCNAGILSAHGLNWKLLFYMAFTDPVGLMERSDATIQRVGEINEDGMGRVFAANVFGHYVMVSWPHRSWQSLLFLN